MNLSTTELSIRWKNSIKFMFETFIKPALKYKLRILDQNIEEYELLIILVEPKKVGWKKYKCRLQWRE